MKTNKKTIIEDERTQLIELKGIRFAAEITLIFIFIAGFITLCFTKSIVSIIWPLAIFILYSFLYYGYMTKHSANLVPSTFLSTILRIDISKLNKSKRIVLYILEGLLFGITVYIMRSLSIHYGIYPWSQTDSNKFIIIVVLFGVVFNGLIYFSVMGFISERKLRKYNNKLNELENLDE